ncbi:MAG TPA: glycosyltransferase [Anaerolineae bacterium]|nr:glycosyltransferase [Anaerolineae bacterium]
MSENFAVTVYISSYNHARYLPQTIDSVLTQSFQDFELLILDDGSSDNSHEVLSDYQRRYPDKIRYMWHEGHANRGISYSCNIALTKARGTYFTWLGSDDYWLPEKLAIQVKFMDEHPKVGLSYTAAHTISAAGELFPAIGAQGYVSSDAWRQFIIANPIIASTAMVARHCFDVVGVFAEDLVFSDWELWIRLAAKYDVAFLPEPLAAYRVHGQNISISNKKAATILAHNLAVIETASRELPELIDAELKSKSLANVHLRAGLDYFANGQTEEGKASWAQASQYLNSTLPCASESALVDAISAYAVHILQAGGWPETQCGQFIQTVCRAVAPGLEKQTLAQFHVVEAYMSHDQKRPADVRRHVAQAIKCSPRWALDRGLLSISVDALAGPEISKRLRSTMRRARPSKA